MSANVVLAELDGRGVARVTLNRPAVGNAYDLAVIEGLAEAFQRLAADARVRVLVLRGAGKNFQAGADLGFLRRAGSAPPAENLAISRRTGVMFEALRHFPRPTVALVQGACYGGGTGMVACCDTAIATEDASFSITEVRWGVAPALIVPALSAKMGLGAITRYALSAERFSAAAALRLGLVHELCLPGKLDEAAAPLVENFLLAAPEAVAATKRLAFDLAAGALAGPGLAEHLAGEAAARRQMPEAAEGLASFFEKRKPRWYPG